MHQSTTTTPLTQSLPHKSRDTGFNCIYGYARDRTGPIRSLCKQHETIRCGQANDTLDTNSPTDYRYLLSEPLLSSYSCLISARNNPISSSRYSCLLLYRLSLTTQIDWQATHIRIIGPTRQFFAFYFTNLLADSQPSHVTLTSLGRKK